MREEDFLQDVTLVGDDNSQIAAHKLVLFACSEILNLPIWANFVDPTDLSLYYLPTLDQPTLFYSLNLNLNLNQAGQAERVEYCPYTTTYL